MAKEKAKSLKPWQHEITKDEYQKEMMAGNTRTVGQNKGLNKFYRVDFENKEYLKYRADRVANRKKRVQARIDRAVSITTKKVTRQAIKDFKNSDAFKKIIAAAEKRGAKAAKPKVSLADRIAKKKAKLAAEEKQLKALEAKAKQ